jgi:hypothetical protein
MIAGLDVIAIILLVIAWLVWRAAKIAGRFADRQYGVPDQLNEVIRKLNRIDDILLRIEDSVPQASGAVCRTIRDEMSRDE